MKTDHDLIVIGGGSGGIATARRAAEYGARVALVEAGAIGGTCVNVGCVPKKIMWTTSRIAEILQDAAGYGFRIDEPAFDWATIKRARDAYVARLNGIYHRNLERSSVEEIAGVARFEDARTVVVGERRLCAPHMLIATGGQPRVPDIPGAGLGITSDGFFELTERPDRVAIVGAGYIAVEFAGVLNGLGAETHLVIRYGEPLRSFDASLRALVTDCMRADGVQIHGGSPVSRLERDGTGSLVLHLASGERLDGLDCVIWAIGRDPNVAALELPRAGVETDEDGFIVTDGFQDTSAAGVYAVGDVTGRAALTPVAIAAGRRLADRLFGGQPQARLDYENIPSVVFSHPPIGTVGLSEQEALERHGEAVRVYEGAFINLYFGVLERKQRSVVKLVTLGEDGPVLGCHMAGEGADEAIQGFAVALRAGATKRDFDNTVAIHPTAAEELVTLRGARPAA